MKNEPRKEAIALVYDAAKQDAPVVKAKGKGIVADNIIRKAKENHVPIQQDANMVELLGELEINETIPEELYQVVAELFAFLYQIDKKAGSR